MSGGGKNQTTKSTTQIPAWVKEQYLKATGMASNAASTPWKSYSSDPNAFVAPMNDTQNAGMANINEHANDAQPWYQGAGAATVAGLGGADLGGLDIDQYMNPFMRNVAQTQSDLMNQQNQQAMSGQLGNAVQSGAAWGDRSGIAMANLNQQQNLANANILNNLLYQGYTNAQGVATQQQGADLAARQANLARLMQGGAQLGELGSNAQAAALQGGAAQMDAGKQQQQTEQAGKSALYNQWLQQQAYPFQTAQFFANIAEGIGSNAGSTNKTTSPAGFFSGLARGGRAGKAMGGGLAGASMGGPVGAEHALEGFADGGAPSDYATMVLKGLLGGADPSAGAYGMAGGMPGVRGFVPKPSMQVTGLKPAEPAPVSHPTTAKDVVNTAKAGYDAYKSDAGQKAMEYAKTHMGAMSGSPTGAAHGGRIGYADGGFPFEDPLMNPVTPDGSGGYVPAPTPADHKGLAAAPAAPAPKNDGLGKVADLVKIGSTAASAVPAASAAASSISAMLPLLLAPIGLKSGGVAGGRQHYDVGGDVAPDGQSWEDWFLNGGASHPNPDMSALHSNPTPPAPAAQHPAPATPSPGLAPAARPPAPAPQNNTEALNQAQKDAQKSVDQLWAESQDPHMGRVQSGLKMGEAALAKGIGVYLPGMINWANGDPTQANGIGGAPAAAPEAPAAPATTPAAPTSAAPAGDFRSPGGLQPAPAPAPTPVPVSDTAPAPHSGAQHPPGLAPPISPVEQMAGERQSGLRIYQATASHDENTHRINFSDPNGGTLAGFNLGQYRALNPSIRSLHDVQPHDIADAQAHWWRTNGGDAIEAKYGPAFAASYVNLSMLNPNMAKHALEQAGGDPSKFFDVMGHKLASLGGPNVPGWLSRVNSNKQIAMSGGAGVPSMGGSSVVPVEGGAPRKGLAGLFDKVTGVQPASTTVPGQPGGIGQALSGAGDWMKRNQGILIPTLQGLGAMASSPSRYLGSAILQGIGAGAGSYLDTQKQLTDNAKNSLQTTTYGNIMWTKDGPMPATEWAKMQKEGNAPEPMGFTPQGDGSTVGNIPGMSDAVTAPLATLGSGVNFGNASKQFAQNEGNTALGGGPQAESAIKRGESYVTGVTENAQAARDNFINVNETARNLAGVVNQTGWDAPGAFFQNRSNLTNIANTFARAFGKEPISDADSQQAIADKISTISGAIRAAGGNQQSEAALEMLAKANANPDMPPRAIAELLSNLMVSGERSIDQQNHMSVYGKMSNGIYSDAAQAFEADNPNRNYALDQGAIRDFLIKDPNTFSEIFSGKYTPAQIDDAFKKATGRPGMSRYFVGGR